ncbi:putative methyltransferase-domain-containing protein [Globomyces pollinis-pini]|nr:putative methyltransferase-domain-containing protein [Globomyces pollinis-pini]
MLMICGPSWPDFEFENEDAQNSFRINDHCIRLANQTKGINDQIHTIRTANSVWDGSLVLAKYLERNQSYLDLSNKSVIEIGAGRGIVGLSCAVLGPKSVVLTDVEPIIPTLMKSISLNKLSNITASALDWNDNAGINQKFDLILASDVVWVYELIEPLVFTLKNLTHATSTILLSHQSRSTRADVHLFELLTQHGFKYELIDKSLLDPVIQRDVINIYKIVR